MTKIDDRTTHRTPAEASRTLRILVLNSGYLSAVPSGGDRHLLALGGALGEDHRVDYVAPDAVRKLLPETVRPVVFRSGLPRSLLATLAVYAYRTVRASFVAWRRRADVVLASPGLFDALPAALHHRRFRSRTVVFAFHIGDPSGQRSRSWIQRRLALMAQTLAARLWLRADVVVTSTEEVAGQLRAMGVPADRILLQRPCVDVGGIRASTPADDAPDVLFVGRLVRRKGVFDLLEAAAAHSASVGLVGDGEERERLGEEIRRRGLDERVTLYGPVSDARLWSLLRGARCLVLPSYEEGYSLVIAEALVAEIPVLAYDLPHYSEVFGEAITRVPCGDAVTLGREIHALLTGQRTQEQETCRAASHTVKIGTSATAASALLRRLKSARHAELSTAETV
ncbi:MAG: glycosyltransferase family 4 protein [Thermoanaerobaculia bacterium]|nr:glycosyltransferase family 4 protein [Thermoanaerobaculia bacterium]